MRITQNPSAIRENVLERPKPLLLSGLTAGFVALSVAVPYAIHQFVGISAARAFLPMHFFVLCAGLLLGWQPGLVAGLLSPAISYSLSGMPPAPTLFPITLEIATYGLVAGLMKRIFPKNLWLPLIAALIAGRTVLAATVFVRGIPSPLSYLGGSVLAGLPGIAIQIALLPFMVKLFTKRISS